VVVAIETPTSPSYGSSTLPHGS